MRWKPQLGAARRTSVRRTAKTRVERILAGLQARGVDASAAEFLADRIAARVTSLDSAAYESMLDGVALSLTVQHDAAEQLAESATGLQEVERLMGSFATELGKLDEILEVLAAHLRRMRVAVGPDEASRVLH